MRPMPEKIIEQTCDDYAISAKRAVEAGFDMLELHMGHGYLFSQFMSPAYNSRRDKFGGSLENRMRFPRLALRRVREAVGPDVPIVVKLNLQDGFEGGSTLDAVTLTNGEAGGVPSAAGGRQTGQGRGNPEAGGGRGEGNARDVGGGIGRWRIGRNPKTKEAKVISSRDVVLFKPSKEFKEFINLKENG